MTRHALTGLLVLTAAGAAACGPPTVLDCAGRGVKQPAMMAPVDYGWIVVDTSRAMIRAVLDLEVPVEDVNHRFWRLPSLDLQFGASRPQRPSRIHLGNPTCRLTLSEYTECRPEHDDPKRCVRGKPEERCFYPVRAEFILTELPDLDERVVLTIGGSSRFVLAWH